MSTTRKKAGLVAIVAAIGLAPWYVMPAQGASPGGEADAPAAQQATKGKACLANRAGRIKMTDLSAGRVNLRRCGAGRRLMTNVGGPVELPGPGESLEVISSEPGRASRTTTIVVGRDGAVDVSRTTESATGAPDVARTTMRPGKACQVYDNNPDASNRWTKPMNYYVRTRFQPSNISADTMVKAVRAAAFTIQAGMAPCDGFRSDHVSVRMPYQGRTWTAPCRRDWKNVVGMAHVSGFARACNYHDSSGRKSESDVVLKVSARWFQTLTSSCYDRYDLQGVLTHELGHSVGLGHVAGPSLTMSDTTTQTCSYWQRSLGAGDVLGLRALY